MKKLYLLLLLFSVSETLESAEKPNHFYNRKIENNIFGIGEHFEYSVRFGPLTAGKADLYIPEIVTYNDKQCYRIVMEIHSNNFFSKFYKVEDHVESLLDIHGIFPWYFEKHQQEGNYRSERIETFLPEQGLAIENGDTLQVPSFSQDILSIIYYLRTQELAPGKIVPVDNFTDKRNFPINFHVYKNQNIKVPAGKYDCYFLVPRLREGYKHEPKGKLYVWFSDNDLKVPVKILTKTEFGSLTLELLKATKSQQHANITEIMN